MIRIVLDTNVLVSGIFWKGSPNKILLAWLNGDMHLVITQEIFDEYKRVATILSKRDLSIDLDFWLKKIAADSEMIPHATLSEPVSRDPDDDKFIACALAGKVRWIVSGDNDLLTISGYQGIEVITPAHFVTKFTTLKL